MNDRLRVLIVEDDDADAELTRLALEGGGFDLEWRRVDTGEAMRHALDEGEWDAVISDFAMPAFDGMRAFAIFLERRLDIPFIFVSGALGEERAVEAMRAGASDYHLKGHLGRLAVAMRRELRAAKNRRLKSTAEETARKNQRRLALAVEASGVGIFESHVPADSQTFVADRCVEIIGYNQLDVPEPEHIVEWARVLVHPEDLEHVVVACNGFLTGATPALGAETRLRHRQGHWVDVDVRAKAVNRDGSGRVTQLVGVLVDLTERKRLETRLRQTHKMEAIGRLAGGVAHDFNNLLTAIFSFSSFVLEAMTEDDPSRPDMEEVIKAGKRAAELTSQLLTFSRMKQTAPRVISIHEVLTNIQRMLKRLIGEDVDFMIKPGPKDLVVKIDPSELEQVLVNLTVNARDAMPRGGKLTIEVEQVHVDAPLTEAVVDATPGDYALIAVSDTGTGMDPATLAHIFDPFFTTKAAGKGTGLGLATCYGIAHQAGGFIWVYSELGRGSTFKVYLPRAAEARTAIEPPTIVEDLDGTGTILVVEDDVQVRQLAVRSLERRGYRVLQAADGLQGLALSQSEPGEIELLLSDVVMPGMSGREMAEAIKAARPNIRIMFMTGYAPNASFHRGDLAPDASVIQKPFTPEMLAREVKGALTGAHAPH